MTDPSTAELTEAGEVGLAGEALAEDEQLLGPLPGPPAVGRVGEELVDDLLIAQRLVHAAAHVRLAQLDDRAVLQRHPDVAAVVARILVVGIDDVGDLARQREDARSEEHTSELQSLMRISYAVFCLKKKIYTK